MTPKKKKILIGTALIGAALATAAYVYFKGQSATPQPATTTLRPGAKINSAAASVFELVNRLKAQQSVTS